EKLCISTHTPLAGRDTAKTEQPSRRSNFYSHAPCGARQSFMIYDDSILAFLLTRPLRGATAPETGSHTTLTHFYSHAPCGARRFGRPGCYMRLGFLLTRPLRGATRAR